MTGVMDGFFVWVDGLVGTLLLSEKEWLTFLLFSLGIWAGLALAVRALTVLGANVAPFLFRLGIAAGYFLMLNADYLLTRIMRSLGAKPFGLVYAVGELATRALPRMMDATRAGGRRWRREVRVLANRKLLILVTLVLIAWWNGTYCQRHGLPSCQPPSVSVTKPLSDFSDAVAAFVGDAF